MLVGEDLCFSFDPFPLIISLLLLHVSIDNPVLHVSVLPLRGISVFNELSMLSFLSYIPTLLML